MGDFIHVPPAGLMIDALVLGAGFWILYRVLRPSPKWIINQVRHMLGLKIDDDK